MSSVIYTGAFRFPEGDAAGARVLGIGKGLREAGFDVIFAGWEERGRGEDLQKDGSYAFQGFRYVSQGDLRSKQLSAVKRVLRYIFAGERTIRWLRSNDLGNVKAVIAYNGSSVFLIRLNALCRQLGINLILDCTEWYAGGSLVGGPLGLVNLDNQLRMRWLNRRIGKIIVISSYLEKYYLARKCKVLRVPPLVDLADSKWEVESEPPPNEGTLHLIYAGVPARKDIMSNALMGLKMLRDKNHKVVLHLIGPSPQDVNYFSGSKPAELDEMRGAVVYSGRVPQREVPKFLAQADFSVLLRPPDRYAQAGFPTKIVESLSAGVPVIVNRTSDIGEYVYDGKEGILLSDQLVESFVSGVTRVLKMPRQRWLTMRKCAKLRARASFDFRCHVKNLEEFLMGCIA